MGILANSKSSSNIANLSKQTPPSLTKNHSTLSIFGNKNHSHVNLQSNSTASLPKSYSKAGLSPVASSAQISGKQSGELILFDIRIDKTNDTSYTTPIRESSDSLSSFSQPDENYYQDIIIIKGTGQDEVNSEGVPLSGKVVLSVSQPIAIKKLNLRLVGEVKTRITVGENGLERYSTFDKRIYDKIWDYAYFKPFLKFEEKRSDSNTSVPDTSTKQRPNLGHKRSKSGANLMRLASFSNLSFSTTSLSSLAQTGSSSQDVLQPGNYELPFSLITPPNIPESLDLKECYVNYYFTCSIERPSKKTDLILKKKLKIIRTLTPDSVELFETALISNTWPKKVEYALSTPAKSNIIGSLIPLRLELYPLSKKLRLGSIKVQLVEQISVFSPVVGTKTFERVCAKKKVSDPLRSCRYYDEQLASEFPDIIPYENVIIEDRGQFLDKWDIMIYLETPSSLSKVAHDCVIGNFVKVRHKVKFVIGLINPDDHVSELRAALPLHLFVSPFAPVTAKSYYIDPLFNRRSNPNFQEEKEMEDDIYLFDESKNVLVDSVMKAYKVASSEQLNNFGLASNPDASRIDFINGKRKSEISQQSHGEIMEDPLKIRPSHILLPKLRKDTSERDILEYSQKHSSVVIADMMSPPDYNKRMYDTLLTGKSNNASLTEDTVETRNETSLLQGKSNSMSNLDMKRLQYGVSTISINNEQNNVDGLLEENRSESYGSNKGLNRIPSYHDAMISLNKLQNSSVELSDLPPVYNPQWDADFEQNDDIAKLSRSRGNSTDNLSKNNSYSDLTNMSRNQARTNRVARFQLGVSMTPLNTERTSMSRENSEKNMNS
ncbi:unnamed protein product [Hanseniaspora opuntiae]